MPAPVLYSTANANVQALARKAVAGVGRVYGNAVQRAAQDQLRHLSAVAITPEGVRENLGPTWGTRHATAVRVFENRLLQILAELEAAEDEKTKHALREEAATLTQALRNVRSVNGN